MGTGKRLSGINPLAYVGVEPNSPSQVVIQERQPTTNDYNDYNIGTWWLMITAQEVWILISKVGGSSTWIQLFPGAGGGASVFITDGGTANEAGNEVEIRGGVNIGTIGVGKVVTANLNDSIVLTGAVAAVGNVTSGSQVIAGTGLVVTTGGIVSTGITRLTTLSAVGVVQTDVNGNLTTSAGTNGQVLVGSTGAAPAWGNITSTGNTITVTEGANTINLESSGSSGVSFMAYLATSEVFAVSVGTTPETFNVGKVVVLTEDHDTGNNLNLGNGSGTAAFFTAPSAGQYCFISSGLFSVQLAPARAWTITTYKAATPTVPSLSIQGGDASSSGGGQTSVVFSLDTGDVVRFGVRLVSIGSPAVSIIGVTDGSIITMVSGFKL